LRVRIYTQGKWVYIEEVFILRGLGYIEGTWLY
jgi:hypothetical protein